MKNVVDLKFNFFLNQESACEIDENLIEKERMIVTSDLQLFNNTIKFFD